MAPEKKKEEVTDVTNQESEKPIMAEEKESQEKIGLKRERKA